MIGAGAGARDQQEGPTMKRHTQRLCLLGLLFAAVLSGCGGSGSASDTPAGSVPSPSPAPAPGPSPSPSPSPGPSPAPTPAPAPAPGQPGELNAAPVVRFL